MPRLWRHTRPLRLLRADSHPLPLPLDFRSECSAWSSSSIILLILVHPGHKPHSLLEHILKDHGIPVFCLLITMSLYYDAAALLQNDVGAGGSLKNRTYANKSSKHPPAKVFALITKTTLWSPYLKEVIDASGILKVERKVSPNCQTGI